MGDATGDNSVGHSLLGRSLGSNSGNLTQKLAHTCVANSQFLSKSQSGSSADILSQISSFSKVDTDPGASETIA